MEQIANNNWQKLSIPFNEDLEKELKQQHLAAQFIALAGRCLHPQKPDGSNINMQYIPNGNMLLGNSHPDGWTISVALKNLAAQIRNSELSINSEIPLAGKSFDEAFQQFKKELQNVGIDISSLKTEQPYELPTDGLINGKFYQAKEHVIIENTRYRHNARLLINELAERFSDFEPIRIWPHHFDTGTFATLERNKKGNASKTIGLGMAIPDNMVSEPYFYLNFWAEKPLDTEPKPKKLPAGKWMLPDWKGAVLGVSEIIKVQTAEEQYNLVKGFFESGINESIKLLKAG